MNAVTPIEPSIDLGWDRAIRAAHQWRGEAVDILAQGEALVTEMLVKLHSVPGRGGGVKMRQLLGQRLSDLQEAIGPDGPFGVEGKGALTRLTRFREHEALRAALCHGVATVLIDRQRRWMLLIKLVALDASGPKRTNFTIEQQESDALIERLQSDVRNLAFALGQINAALKKTVAEKPPQQARKTAA